MSSTPRLYRLLILSLLFALTVPRMTQRGMFGDGVIHATVARNMSIGVGSFWTPTYTATMITDFHEHPPLGFGLQALAFLVFGDHLVVERLYSLVVFALHAILIAALWRRVRPAAFDWLPLLFWVLPSIVTWAVINNMLENTQAVFSTAAVFLLVVAWQARDTRAVVVWSAIAGFSTVAAALTKGPVGLFPLAVPAFLPLMSPGSGDGDARATSMPRLVVIAGGVVVTVLGCGAVLAAYPPSRHALTEYVQLQLIPSLQGQREVNGDPIAAVRQLGLGVVARMLVIAGAFWWFGRRTAREGAVGPAWFFFAVALCASAPIAISPKLAGHYFLPSVPFFALGFASLALRSARSLERPDAGWHRRAPVALSALLMSAAILVPTLHGVVEPRDTDLVRNLDAVGGTIPRGSVIGACRVSELDWRLHSYVNRFFRVSLGAQDRPVGGWLLQVDGACAPPPDCAPAAAGDRLVLFRCPPGP